MQSTAFHFDMWFHVIIEFVWFEMLRGVSVPWLNNNTNKHKRPIAAIVKCQRWNSIYAR